MIDTKTEEIKQPEFLNDYVSRQAERYKKQGEVERQKIELEQKKAEEEKKQQEIKQIRNDCQILPEIFQKFIITTTQTEFDNAKVGNELYDFSLEDTPFFKILDLVNQHCEFAFLASLLNEVAISYKNLKEACMGIMQAKSYINLSKSVSDLVEYLKLTKQFEAIHLKNITQFHEYKSIYESALFKIENEITEIKESILPIKRQINFQTESIQGIEDAPADVEIVGYEPVEVRHTFVRTETPCWQRGTACSPHCRHQWEETYPMQENQEIVQPVLSEDQKNHIQKLRKERAQTQALLEPLLQDRNTKENLKQQILPRTDLFEEIFTKMKSCLTIENGKVIENLTILDASFLDELVALIFLLNKPIPELKVDNDSIIKLLVGLTLNDNFSEFVKKIDNQLGTQGLQFLLETLIQINSEPQSEPNPILENYITQCSLCLTLRQINNNTRVIKKIIKNADLTFLAKLFNQIDNVTGNSYFHIYNQKDLLLGQCRVQAIRKLKTLIKKEVGRLNKEGENQSAINDKLNHFITCTLQLSLFSHLNKDGSPKTLEPDLDAKFLNELIKLIATLPDYIENNEVFKLLANFSLNENFESILDKIEESLKEKGLQSYLIALVELNEKNPELNDFVNQCKLRLTLLQIETNVANAATILNNEDIPFLSTVFDKIDQIDTQKYPNISKNKFDLLGVCRDQALTKLEEKDSKTNQKDDKIKNLQDAKNLPLIKQHRNHGFFKTIGRTKAVIKIDKMISRTKGSVLTQLVEKVKPNRRNNFRN